MSDTVTLHIPLPPDEHGMVGRVCPSCEQYFKLKPGTGLPTSECTCPYCEHKADASDFATPDQLEYAKSIAVKKLVEPPLRDLEGSFRKLERSTRGSFIRFKAHTSGLHFPIRYYTEKELETTVICDGCGLEFAIYGVFATCPDCTRLTTMSLFLNSLKAAQRRLAVLEAVSAEETGLAEVITVDAISATVASFDALGKRVAREFPALIPDKPKNLFQNLDALNDVVSKNLMVALDDLLPPGEYAKVYYLFQVRHISSHNFGEIDTDFIRKTGVTASLIGTKPSISPSQVEEFIGLTQSLGMALRQKLKDCA